MRDFRQNRIQSKLNYSVKPYIYVILIAQKKQRTNICLIFFAFTTFFRTAFTPQKKAPQILFACCWQTCAEDLRDA